MNVVTLDYFERKAKKLIRKYPSLSQEIADLITSLADDPKQGSYLGSDCYKIRLKIASKGKGKSGGARIITCVKVEYDTVTLLTIYDKSEQEDIADAFLIELLEDNDLL